VLLVVVVVVMILIYSVRGSVFTEHVRESVKLETHWVHDTMRQEFLFFWEDR